VGEETLHPYKTIGKIKVVYILIFMFLDKYISHYALILASSLRQVLPRGLLPSGKRLKLVCISHSPSHTNMNLHYKIRRWYWTQHTVWKYTCKSEMQTMGKQE
jgi:hypothetical protein